MELTSIGRSSGGRAVLSDVSLKVSNGELVSVLGSTGSGKTSLLRLIMGLDLPDTGEVRFENEVLARAGENVISAELRGFSLVFEKTVLLPFLDVEENILLGSNKKNERAQKDFSEICALLELEDLLPRDVPGLSGGEQQRIAVARSLVVRPKLLLLDEPFRNIDRPWRDRLIPGLKRYLKRRDMAAVLVTHDREEAFSFSERVFLLREGRLVRGGTPLALYREPTAEWDARLLGECNILSAETAAEALGFEPGAGDVKLVAVRPEQIEISSEPPPNATLVEELFFGFYSTLVFQLEGEALISVKAMAGEDLVVGARYRLRLRRGALVHGLAAPENLAEGDKP